MKRSYRIKTLEQLRHTPYVEERRNGNFYDSTVSIQGMRIWSREAERNIPQDRVVEVTTDGQLHDWLGAFNGMGLGYLYPSAVASRLDTLGEIESMLHD